jgi:transposase
MGQMIQDSGWRIPDALWERMAPLLPPRPNHPLGCHNPRVPDRAAMDGIFFVLRTGSQWGALDATGICSKSSAHRRFTEWVEAGVFHEFWRLGLLAYDGVAGIDWEWLSADGAMTKAPLGGKKTGPNPTDRGKLGTKRSVVTDARGLPLGFAVAGANVPDYKLLEETLDALPVQRPEALLDQALNLCLDKGYDYDGPRQIAYDYNLTAHIRCRGEESKTLPDDPNYKPRRWVVERVHSWINRFRRLLIRWEKKPENYEAMLQFACGIIVWEHAALLG